MNRARNEIFRSALALEENDRVELAALLLSQSDEPAEPDWEEAWGREIARRAQELDSGVVKPTPWEDIRAHAMQELNADSSR
jgi:hypothetical protein